MLILLTVTVILLATGTIYFLYYKSQIKDIANQLDFISKHDSFKFIQTQIKPKEVAHLIDLCNRILSNQRELNQQFTEKNEEINATIVSLSHDIRTPLTSLDGYLQLAEHTEDTQEKQKYITQAQSRTKQLNRLVDELFLYTKLQNQAYLLEIQSIDIVNVLNHRLLTFVEAFSRKGDEPKIDLPESAVPVLGNEIAIDRVFENIIKNYILHGEGPLEVHSEEKKNEVNLYFINVIKEGKTIDLSLLFTRFYKEDMSRTSHSSGLGLSIVKSLMEKMDGRVEADVVQNQFSICLTFKKSREKDYG